MSSIGAVILASGDARRFGSNKLLAKLQDKPIASYIIETIGQSLKQGCIEQAVCVTRYAELIPLLKDTDIGVVLHSLPLVNDTIRLGTSYFTGSMHGNAPDGIMYCVADQPLLQVQTIASLCMAFQEHPHAIVRLAYTDPKTQTVHYANPVIFPSVYYEELCTLPPEKTGKWIIQQHQDAVITVSVDTYEQICDVDTEEQFAAICRLLGCP